jgi:hypothetical protein
MRRLDSSPLPTDETFDFRASDLFDRYDPVTEIIWMLGESVDLAELEASVQRIRSAAVRAAHAIRDRNRTSEPARNSDGADDSRTIKWVARNLA